MVIQRGLYVKYGCFDFFGWYVLCSYIPVSTLAQIPAFLCRWLPNCQGGLREAPPQPGRRILCVARGCMGRPRLTLTKSTEGMLSRIDPPLATAERMVSAQVR